MSVDGILDGLTAVTNQWPMIAISWHVVLAVMLALIARRAVSHATLASVLAMLILSVAIVAWRAANPFNGLVFAIISGILLWDARTMSRRPVSFASALEVIGGILLVAFGWSYPHFLIATSWTAYLYRPPLGLIPCPTIAAVAGMTLMADRFGSKTWTGVVSMMAISYGLIGVLILGVGIDVALVAAGIMLQVGPVARWSSLARLRSGRL